MIFSHISTDEYKNYPAAIQTALDFIKNTDLVNIEVGTYKIQGDDIYANVFDTVTEPFEDRTPESHKDYLDVQYLVSGEEALGFAMLNDECVVKEYFPERDLFFYSKIGAEGMIQSRPGCYCVFFPNDVHRPQVAVGEPAAARKVVVKVKASLL